MNDPNRDKEPSVAGPLIVFVPLMILCCAAPVIIATGALAGFFAWFSGKGAATIGLAIIVATLGAVIYKARLIRSRDNHTPNSMSKDR